VELSPQTHSHSQPLHHHHRLAFTSTNPLHTMSSLLGNAAKFAAAAETYRSVGYAAVRACVPGFVIHNAENDVVEVLKNTPVGVTFLRAVQRRPNRPHRPHPVASLLCWLFVVERDCFLAFAVRAHRPTPPS
jgi:hypothetical protein